MKLYVSPPSLTLARDGESLVKCWTVELSRLNRELFAFVVTADLQFWHHTRWWVDRAPDWWRTWWAP